MKLVILLGALVFVYMAFSAAAATDLMPGACPRCGMGDLRFAWRTAGAPRLQVCELCGARFREHANGTWVDADREPPARG